MFENRRQLCEWVLTQPTYYYVWQIGFPASRHYQTLAEAEADARRRTTAALVYVVRGTFGCSIAEAKGYGLA